MNTTKLPEPMDITLYLQTEGRRIAAELERRRPRDNAIQQQQCATPDVQQPPRSLSETLQRMGVTPGQARRL